MVINHLLNGMILQVTLQKHKKDLSGKKQSDKPTNLFDNPS